MPWCDDCDRYFAPSAMTPEGACPECGTDLEPPERDEAERADLEDEGTPWHFKLLVVMLIAYLVWRSYEMFFA